MYIGLGVYSYVLDEKVVLGVLGVVGFVGPELELSKP